VGTVGAIDKDLLNYAAQQAMDYLEGLPERHVAPTAKTADLLELLGGPLPDESTPAMETIEVLSRAAAEGGVIASSGPRYFGYVIGGTLPVSIAADWMASAWDQNAGAFDLGPAVAVAEHTAAHWLVELFGLPEETTVGFPTGCMMANAAALASARHHVLAKASWDVERDGLAGAPKVHVVAGGARHATIDIALRYLGFGTSATRIVPADDQGRMRVEELEPVLDRCEGPIIVCAQAGEVNTGAVDPLEQIIEIAHQHGAWVHVDGAFGLWAAASEKLRPLVKGIDKADSWASDAHKWLNVPYDCGLVFVAHPEAHRGAMLDTHAGYLPAFGTPGERDGTQFVMDFSRRARSLPVWAALRSLGRAGVVDLVDRCCVLARRFAKKLAATPGIKVLNDVVLNQVLLRFADDDDLTRDVVARIKASGVCWFGGTVWDGKAAMRISVSSWQTTEADVDRCVKTIRACLRAAIKARP
jgi:glutamate/tyrosine decarboxylase-like PLP-dependent enzyme